MIATVNAQLLAGLFVFLLGVYFTLLGHEIIGARTEDPTWESRMKTLRTTGPIMIFGGGFMMLTAQ